nr:B3 domain-containing protein At5g18000-like isoform X2 [Solanum lycopersicum]
MLVDPNKHPSFCKLLFKQGFMDKIKTFKNSSGRGAFQELTSSSEEEHDVGIARKLKKMKMEQKESSGVVKKEEAEGGKEENVPKTTRFSVININNKDPYFEMVVRKTHSFFMTIPKSFAIWTGITKMKKMRLVNGNGNKWKLVDIVHTQQRVYMKRGWAGFRTLNRIGNGQTCRFKLIKENCCEYSVLQVQKIHKSKCLK